MIKLLLVGSLAVVGRCRTSIPSPSLGWDLPSHTLTVLRTLGLFSTVLSFSNTPLSLRLGHLCFFFEILAILALIFFDRASKQISMLLLLLPYLLQLLLGFLAFTSRSTHLVQNYGVCHRYPFSKFNHITLILLLNFPPITKFSSYI